MTLYLMQFFGGKRRQSQTNNGWCLLTDPMAAVNIHSPNAFLQPLSSVHSKYIDQADGWSFPRLLLLFLFAYWSPFFLQSTQSITANPQMLPFTQLSWRGSRMCHRLSMPCPYRNEQQFSSSLYISMDHGGHVDFTRRRQYLLALIHHQWERLPLVTINQTVKCSSTTWTNASISVSNRPRLLITYFNDNFI